MSVKLFLLVAVITVAATHATNPQFVETSVSLRGRAQATDKVGATFPIILHEKTLSTQSWGGAIFAVRASTAYAATYEYSPSKPIAETAVEYPNLKGFDKWNGRLVLMSHGALMPKSNPTRGAFAVKGMGDRKASELGQKVGAWLKTKGVIANLKKVDFFACWIGWGSGTYFKVFKRELQAQGAGKDVKIVGPQYKVAVASANSVIQLKNKTGTDMLKTTITVQEWLKSGGWGPPIQQGDPKVNGVIKKSLVTKQTTVIRTYDGDASVGTPEPEHDEDPHIATCPSSDEVITGVTTPPPFLAVSNRF